MELITTCKNCDNHFEGRYCNNCGQPAATHKLNGHFLWHDLQHGLLHFDKGIPYTLKELFTRPGYSIREFIEGKRVKHFKPLSLVVILATVYGLLFHVWHIESFIIANMKTTGSDPKAVANGVAQVKKITDWVSTHRAIAIIITLPFWTLGSYLAFRKQGYNFVEHFVINTFLAGQKLALEIVFMPFLVLTKNPLIQTALVEIVSLLGFMLTYWCFKQFFSKLSGIKTFFLTVLSYLIAFTGFIGLVLGIAYIATLLFGGHMKLTI